MLLSVKDYKKCIQNFVFCMKYDGSIFIFWTKCSLNEADINNSLFPTYLSHLVSNSNNCHTLHDTKLNEIMLFFFFIIEKLVDDERCLTSNSWILLPVSTKTIKRLNSGWLLAKSALTFAISNRWFKICVMYFA